MIYKKLYLVYLDGNFVGITDDEMECWEIAQNHVNGYDTLLDDDVDRVWWETIDVNRWKQCNNAILCAEDKYTGETIVCNSIMEVKKVVPYLNQLDLQRERAEAKLRALAL